MKLTKAILFLIFSFFIGASVFVFNNSIDLSKKLEKQINPSKCIDGVLYLIFPQGVSVQYNKNGSIKTCE